MLRRAVSGRAVIYLAGISRGVSDERGNGLRRKRWIYLHDKRNAVDARDRCNIRARPQRSATDGVGACPERATDGLNGARLTSNLAAVLRTLRSPLESVPDSLFLELIFIGAGSEGDGAA